MMDEDKFLGTFMKERIEKCDINIKKITQNFENVRSYWMNVDEWTRHNDRIQAEARKRRAETERELRELELREKEQRAETEHEIRELARLEKELQGKNKLLKMKWKYILSHIL